MALPWHRFFAKLSAQFLVEDRRLATREKEMPQRTRRRNS
jgi:hypothetical protein